MWPFKTKDVPVQSEGERAMSQWTALDSRMRSIIQSGIDTDRKESAYLHTCKPDDDAFYEMIKQCRAVLAEKQIQVDYEREIVGKEILGMLSKFPLNLPCTSDTIAIRLDLTKSVVESLLADVRKFSLFVYDPQYRDSIPVYISRHLGVDATDWAERHELTHDRVITSSWIVDLDMEGEECSIHSMKYSNWQFVASKKVTYLERIA